MSSSSSLTTGGLVAASVCALGLLLSKSYSRNKESRERAALKKTNVYESPKLLDEYLMMHFGTEEELLPYEFGPKSALEFPKRCAEECNKAAERDAELPKARVLDVGCAVGRSTFELARFFDEAVGIDFSYAFIDTANELKEAGSKAYRMQTEGDLSVACVAQVDPTLDRSKTSFFQGDGCNLDPSLGKFSVVLAANLLCRLPKPSRFLETVGDFLEDGGYLVMPSPYSWLEQFTPKSEWIGGYVDEAGREVTTFEGISKHLEGKFDLVEERGMPFFIRETARKNQWTVSHLTVWKKKLAA